MRNRLTVLLCAVPTLAWAQVATEDLDLLDRRIASFLAGAAEGATAVTPIDRRLRLARCPEAATIDPPALGAVAVRCEALGWRIRVPVTRPTAPSAELVIRRGDPVDLAYRGAGFSVAVAATALEDGRMGAPIRVKTLTGTGALTARVRASGEVSIGD